MKMMNDPLANAMSLMTNAENRNIKECTLSPVSNMTKKILKIMEQKSYIGSFEEIETAQGTRIKVKLISAINKCGAVKPRYSVQNRNFEKYEKQYLPAKNFGFLIVSTPQGLMTHNEAKQKSLGGRLIAYFY